MLSGLVRHMEGGVAVCAPTLGSPSSYLWEDFEGVVHEVLQGEGGEQGDALMPALFSLGQHDALVAIQGLALDERLMAFLDDKNAVGGRSGRTGAAYTVLQEELRTRTRENTVVESSRSHTSRQCSFDGSCTSG